MVGDPMSSGPWNKCGGKMHPLTTYCGNQLIDGSLVWNGGSHSPERWLKVLRIIQVNSRGFF